MLIDYHIHALSHGEYRPDAEWYQEYLLRAAASGLAEIGFSEHDEYWEQVRPDFIRAQALKFPGLQVKVGLETEFRHYKQLELEKFLLKGGLDYIIGSVHFLGDWNFDHPDYKDRFSSYSIDEIYQQYFAEIGAMMASRCFDIVGHLDLIKIWGHRPSKKISHYLEPVWNELRQAGMAVEINSGGLRKPVGEFYPEPALLEKMYAKNIPVTLGSDAHHPDQVGWELDRALLMVRQAGYRKIAGFTGRKLHLLAL